MKRLIAIVALGLAAAPALGTELVLRDAERAGCPEVRGHHVAFLLPGEGIVLLASRAFPGGDRAGEIRQGRFEGTLPGLGAARLGLEADEGAPIWAMLDRSLPVGARTGCFGFGPRRFSDVDDLKTYLHWFVREVLDRLAATGETAPAVWLAGRTVALRIESPTHAPLLLRGVEGTTLGFEPEGSTTRFYFQPFVLGQADRSVGVRISAKAGDYYGPGIVEEIAFVVIGPDLATPIPTQPPLALRLESILDRVDFDR